MPAGNGLVTSCVQHGLGGGLERPPSSAPPDRRLPSPNPQGPMPSRFSSRGRAAAFVLGALALGGLAACTDRAGDGADSTAADTAAMTPTEMAAPDSQMAAVLSELAALGGKPIETLSAAEARQQPTPADAVMALLRKQGRSTAPEPVGNVADRTIPGAAGPIAARVYTPAGTAPAGGWPVVVYYHGGGFVIATIDTYDASGRALANAAQAVVLSVEYRKGPEHKFPAAHDDAFAAYQWAVANAAGIGGNPAKVAVAGESAGGNLATTVAMRAKAQNVQAPVHQLLVYPVVNTDTTTASYVENANAKPLNRAMMGWFVRNYTSSPAEATDPRLTPLTQPLAGLPSATVITAQIDPLRSEGEAYAEALRAAGVETNARTYDGVTHEFFGMGAVHPKAKDAVAFAAADLKAAFAR